MMQVTSTIFLFIMGGVFTILWSLLKKKDNAQEKQIELLFELHDKDSQRLQDFELLVAKDHYVKVELDRMYDKLELTVKEGFNSLGNKFDDLSKVLQHIQSGEKH